MDHCYYYYLYNSERFYFDLFIDQNEWQKTYPSCSGRSQSPVDILYTGLVKIKGYRELSFINYDIYPRSLTLTNDGKRGITFFFLSIARALC